jgi:hypothetical protein
VCVCIPSFISAQGAIPLCPTGYGDDNSPNGGVFADFDTWIEHSFFPALLPSFTNTLLSGAVNHVTDDSLTISPPSYKVTVLPKVELGGGGNTTVMEFYNSVYLNDFFRSLAPQTAYTYTDGLIRNRYANDGLRSFPLHGRIVGNQRISAHGWYQDVRHLRIEVDTTWQSVASDENGRKTRKDDNGPLYIHPQIFISNEAESVGLVCRYCTSKSGDRCVAVLWPPPGVVLSVWSSLRQEDTGGRTEVH